MLKTHRQFVCDCCDGCGYAFSTASSDADAEERLRQEGWVILKNKAQSTKKAHLCPRCGVRVSNMLRRIGVPLDAY